LVTRESANQLTEEGSDGCVDERRLNNDLQLSDLLMPQDNSRSIRIRVKSGESEAEIETSMSAIHEAIELIPQVLAKLPPPQPSWERRAPTPTAGMDASSVAHPHEAASAVALSTPSVPQSAIPLVTVEKGDSLSDVISKFFADSWGRNPRKLMDVREALQSYGLNYPKQSVAVALLRLAKGSKIRRFKGEGGEYVYTASTGAVRIAAPVQSAGPGPSQEDEMAVAATMAAGGASTAETDSPPETSVPEASRGEPDPESQLNLDAPSAN
jgi:hypothetical protein